MAKKKVDDPERQEKLRKVYESLKRVRESKTVTLKESALMRKTFKAIDGSELDFKLRYYQVQGIYHLLVLKRMVLGDDTGLGKCQPADTLILTDSGLQELGSLADWESWEPDTFGPLKSDCSVLVGGEAYPVKQFYFSGKKPTIKVTTRSYYETEGSEVHPLLVRTPDGERWVQTRDLKVGDYLCIERCPASFPPTDPALDNSLDPALPARMSPALARFVGYYIGSSREINPEVYDDIRNLVENVLGEPTPEGETIYLRRKTLRQAFAANGFGLQQSFATNSLGYCPPSDREVPPCILGASRASVREFLRAVLEGEGSVVPYGLEYITASERMSKQVQILLLRFGIVAQRSLSPTYCKLTISGRNAWLFQQELGFISSHKIQALRSSLTEDSNPNLDVVPHSRGLVATVRSEISKAVTKTGASDTRGGSGLEQFGVSFVDILNNDERNHSYAFLETLETILRSVAPESPHLEALSRLNNRRFFYDPVVKLDRGFTPVMDLEIDHPSHAFVGNGFLSHNTIESITAMAHLFERDPTVKVMIVTPKSTVKQWASEILRFTTGIRPLIAETTASKKGGKTPLEQRKDVYREWAEAPTGEGLERVVLIMNYALLVRDWNAEGFQPVKEDGKPDPLQPVMPGVLDLATKEVGAAGKLVVFEDECFDYFTPVQLADGTTDVIGRIVNQKLEVKVLSWNWETQQVESRAVIHWFKKPKGTKKLLKVVTRAGRSYRVTTSHIFYTKGGARIRAGLLKPGTHLAYLDTNAPSEDQTQIILGGLLGDASVKKSPTPNGLRGIAFVQGNQQKAYLDYKRSVLETLGVSAISTRISGYTNKDSLWGFSLRSNATVSTWDLLDPNGKKSPTLSWLGRITPLGLAIWYGDDGSLATRINQDGRKSYSIDLHTQGFTREGCTLLQSWLYFKWGVLSKLCFDKKGYRLSLGAAASAHFLSLLPGALPGVEYKFPGKPPIQIRGQQPQTQLVDDLVLRVEPCLPQHKDNSVYDLEVEGNHNYFVGRGTLVSNCQAFKNMRTKTWEIARFLNDRADRVIGLTATLLGSNLMEGYCIYKAIKPELFGNKTAFLKAYCHTELQAIPGKRQKIPIVVGYKNLTHYRETIDPFFLGRFKHQVSDELPAVLSKDIICELSEAENKKYGEALSGILELGDGELKDYEANRTLVALIYCQQVVDSLTLLKFSEGDVVDETFDYEALENKDVKVGVLGAKETALMDLLSAEGELEGEKVIVYTRFASLVPRLIKVLEKQKIKSVFITGKANEKARQEAQTKFQDIRSDVKVIFITDAGGVGINLQMGKALIFYDLPWTWGQYVQILGRLVRIGSPHKGVAAYHLMAERPFDQGSRKTIDHHVLALLRKKKRLIDQVLGEGIKDALEFEEDGVSLKSLMAAMQKEAQDAR